MYGANGSLPLGIYYGTGGYSLKVTTPPATEPVSLEAAKLHLRVDHTAEDAKIAQLIASARELAEKHAGQCWLEQTLTMRLDGWPMEGEIRLPVEPVRSVTTIKYFDAAGTEITWGAGNWQTWLDHSPPLIVPAPMGYFPGLQAGKVAPVEIVFVAGGTDATECPSRLKDAILLTLGYLYEHRGDTRDPTEHGLPLGAKRLLDSLDVSGYR